MHIECPIVKYLGKRYEDVRANWILVSSTNVELLSGFLLAGCRHLSMQRLEDEFTELAIQYKVRCIQSLQEVMSATDLLTNRTAIAKALVLAFDDVSLLSKSLS